MKNRILVASSLLALMLVASPSYAAADTEKEIAILKEQIAKLTKKIDQMETQTRKEKAEAKKTAAAAPAPVAIAPAPATDKTTLSSTPAPKTVAAAAVNEDEVVTKGSFPGSFHIPGTSTSVKLGGYVKLDLVENIGVGYDQSYARFFMIPLGNTAAADRSSQTTFSAQQSRVNFETRTASFLGEIKTFVEGDFYGASGTNSNTSTYGFMLRHAYGSVGTPAKGQLLAGQTWSNLMDTNAMPESLDYIGPAGTIFVRQPQVRYTQAFGPLTLSGSVEVPANVVQATQNGIYQANPTTSGTTVTNRPRLPDLIARGDYAYAKDGYVSLRAVVNQINVDKKASTAIGNENTAVAMGYGLALSGKQGVFDKDSIVYDFVGGNGTGRYDFDVNAAAAYYSTATGNLKTQPYYGGTFGYQHLWSDEFRSNIFGGFTRILNNTGFLNATAQGVANKFVASGHANLIWQPAPSYKIGIEYMYGYRKVITGTDGDINRLQGSFMYSF